MIKDRMGTVKRKECSLKNFVAIDQCASLIDWSKTFGNDNPLEVEIGFGTGEHLIALATESPGRNFVGIEQDRKRLLKTARKITLKEEADAVLLENIRLLGVDAWLVFERLFNVSTIANIHCLFPCPWPKKKHIKFRLFNHAFLQLLNNRLQAQGILRIVTDFFPFYQWILEEVPGTGFVVRKEVIEPRFNTKFEKKWRGLGQEEFFQLSLMKEKHIDVPVKSEVSLKAYKLQNFNPEMFCFEDREGATSVVLKEMLFDSIREKAMLMFVVAEADLTQNFWVSISKKNHEWIVGRAIGQNLLQTDGLALTLELVARAVAESAC